MMMYIYIIIFDYIYRDYIYILMYILYIQCTYNMSKQFHRWGFSQQTNMAGPPPVDHPSFVSSVGSRRYDGAQVPPR